MDEKSAKETSSFNNLRRLFVTLVEKYHPFNYKYFKVLVGVIMTLLLGAVFILGLMSSRKVKEIVTEDFNQQQLLLARHVARQIENSLETLRRELRAVESFSLHPIFRGSLDEKQGGEFVLEHQT